eukprot:1178200-Prorocentrum_minimum.AAC.5
MWCLKFSQNTHRKAIVLANHMQKGQGVSLHERALALNRFLHLIAPPLNDFRSGLEQVHAAHLSRSGRVSPTKCFAEQTDNL